MNWKTSLKNAGTSTVITLFITSILIAFLMLSGGMPVMITEISIPFVFFGLNLLLFVVLRRIDRRKIAATIQVCANLVLLAGYVVLLSCL